MRDWKALLAFALLALAPLTEGHAGESPVVVELFTSEGCSSCPPAEALLGDLSKRKDVIPLAFHVDYWDYIGWKDRFASPAFTARQHGYSRAGGRRSVYTPQMILQGQAHVVGTRPQEVEALIDRYAQQPDAARLQIRKTGENTTEISAQSLIPEQGEVALIVVQYQPDAQSKVLRGENAGKTLRHVNVVRVFQTLKTWRGTETITVVVQLDPALPAVALVQEEDHGAILASARLR